MRHEIDICLAREVSDSLWMHVRMF